MPAQDVAVRSYPGQPLQPLKLPHLASTKPVNLGPSVTLLKGTVLGQVAASANDVQTFSITGTPTGGTFTLSGVNPLSGAAFTTGAIAYNANAAAVQAALVAVLGSGNVTCSGGALPGTPVVVTLAGALAQMPMPTMTATLSSLTGGTPAFSIAHTTTGCTAGTFAAYSSAVLAAPSAPTVAGNGAGSAFAAGSYAVSVTLVTALGETTPSPATVATVTAAQNLRVSAINSLNSLVTAVNYYVNGVKMATTAVASGTAAQTDITGSALAVSGHPPLVNTAYSQPNGLGTHIARGVLQYDCTTDSQGNIVYSQSTSAEQHGLQPELSAAIYTRGYFDVTQLIGLDAKAIADMGGNLESGTVAGPGVVFI